MNHSHSETWWWHHDAVGILFFSWERDAGERRNLLRGRKSKETGVEVHIPAGGKTPKTHRVRAATEKLLSYV